MLIFSPLYTIHFTIHLRAFFVLLYVLCDLQQLFCEGFSLKAYLSLVSVTHKHGLVVNVKKGPPFLHELSLEISEESH